MSILSLLSLFSSEVTTDAANTLVFERKKGIVVNEPSIVALDQTSGDVEAVGSQAKEMSGRTHQQNRCETDEKGVIADFEATSRMRNHFISTRKRLVHPRIVIALPANSPRWNAAR
jgi:rod shape-determining protein MreB